jgi:large subunit ribosomal protein L32e
VRTEKGAVFKRDGFGKKRQLSDSWRKPRGQHNKQREQKKAKGALPKPGYGSPVAVRGMHPSGFFEVLVFTESDLENLDVKTQAIRISAGVGGRKRKALQEKAAEAGFKILNARVIKAPVKKEEPAESEKDEAKDKKESKKEAPAKKSVSKAEPAKKKGAEEKKPVKSSASKSKPAAKETEKKEEKAAKPKAKEAAKAPEKKAAPQKSEKKPALGEKVPKEKAKAKKQSSSEVKKND